MARQQRRPIEFLDVVLFISFAVLPAEASGRERKRTDGSTTLRILAPVHRKKQLLLQHAEREPANKRHSSTPARPSDFDLSQAPGTPHGAGDSYETWPGATN